MKSLVEIVQPLQKMNIVRNILTEDGSFPNNSLLPLLVYQQALLLKGEQHTGLVKEILETNRWTDAWVDGIHDYHHYHSSAHEIIVVLKGAARVQFGGPNGLTVNLQTGDVAIIPAGVSHRKVDEADGFTCLGAYPEGQDWDMNLGKEEERERALENIRKTPMPENDPLYGSDGPLNKNWLSAKDQNPSVL